jgi:hypothetical protein
MSEKNVSTGSMSIGNNPKDVTQVYGDYYESNYSEMKDVFLELYNANNYKVQNELLSIVNDRIALLSYKFSEEIEKIKKSKLIDEEELIKRIKEPATQILANQCLYQAVYKDDIYTTEILSKLLAEKITKNSNNNYLVEDCIDSLRFISQNDINFLSIIYSISWMQYSIDSFSVLTYYDQVKNLDISDIKKEQQIKNLTNYFVNLYRKIGKYYLVNNCGEVDYNYLMNKGWFYSNIMQVPDPIMRISQILRKSDGSRHTVEEIQILIPELNDAWIRYNGMTFQGNRLSSIGQLLAAKNTENLLQNLPSL